MPSRVLPSLFTLKQCFELNQEKQVIPKFNDFASIYVKQLFDTQPASNGTAIDSCSVLIHLVQRKV
jgi:hypothetical protein